MAQSDKKEMDGIVILVVVIMTVAIIIEWMLFNNLVSPNTSNPFGKMFHQFGDTMYKHRYVIRSIYVLMLFLSMYLRPSMKVSKKTREGEKQTYLIAALSLSALVIVGHIGFRPYDLFIWPFILLMNIIAVVRAMSLLKGRVEEESMLDNVNEKYKEGTSYLLGTNKGELSVLNPMQGIWIEGGAGSGKSASLVDPMIEQSILMGWSSLIYDFKGNPPTLGLTAYNSVLKAKRNNIPVGKLAFINFSNLAQTVKVNPISPKYIKSMLDATEAASTIMKNLEKSWIEKTDFWANNAINYITGIIYMLSKYKPEYCTLPHVVAISLLEYDITLEWLSQDDDVRKLMSPLIIAHERNAEGQLAGAISSSQLPMNKLFNEEIFWVMNPTDSEYDLNINLKDNPKILVICNDNLRVEALSPAISLIISTVKTAINQKGRANCAFIVDELPTLYIKDLDQLPATARSNGVATILALQERSQLVANYGNKVADKIRANLGNKFIGMTNDSKTADLEAKQFGTIQKKKISYSTSDENISQSESLQNEQVLQARDIAGQNIGHFSGKIAGGDPSFFHAQFDYFDNQKVKDIPEFSYPVDTGDREKNIQILQQEVTKNFRRVIAQCDDYLEEYKQIALEKRGNK